MRSYFEVAEKNRMAITISFWMRMTRWITVLYHSTVSWYWRNFFFLGTLIFLYGMIRFQFFCKSFKAVVIVENTRVLYIIKLVLCFLFVRCKLQWFMYGISFCSTLLILFLQRTLSNKTVSVFMIVRTG